MARSSRAAIVARQNDSGRDRRALRLGNDLLRFHPGKNRRVPCGFGVQRERNRLIEIEIYPTPLSCAETARVWLCKPQKRGWDDKKTFNDLRRAIGQEQQIREWERSLTSDN